MFDKLLIERGSSHLEFLKVLEYLLISNYNLNKYILTSLTLKLGLQSSSSFNILKQTAPLG